MNKEKIEVKGATVDFFTYIIDGVTHYSFDSSELGPPEPMVNAMAGLALLKDGDKLVMINHTAPSVLFSRIEAEFSHEVKDGEDGKKIITFERKKGAAHTTDFTNTKCGGGC